MGKYGVVAIGGNRTHQEGYAREFAADPRCDLIAVADEPNLPEYREGLNRLLASELGVPYLSLDDALARDDVHIVDNCADVERRGRVGVKAVEAGKHLFMDKPLAASVEDAHMMADAADRAGVVTQMFSQVTTSWARAAKATVDSGRIGKVQALHCDMLMAKGKLGTVSPGTVRREQPSSGVFTHVAAKRELFDMGVYPISLVHWLSGQRVKTVYGITGNYFFKEHAALGIEDYGALALTLADGRVASITSGRIGVTSHPRGGQQRITLIGEEWHSDVSASPIRTSRSTTINRRSRCPWCTPSTRCRCGGLPSAKHSRGTRIACCRLMVEDKAGTSPHSSIASRTGYGLR